MGRLAHAMALDSAQISADVVEVQEFPSLASFYGVRSVPLTVINEQIRLLGASLFDGLEQFYRNQVLFTSGCQFRSDQRVHMQDVKFAIGQTVRN